MILRPIFISVALSAVAGCSGPSLPSKGLLHESTSKDGLVRRSVLSNGDYCHVRHFRGEGHAGLRIAYFIPERDSNEREIKSIIKSLVQRFCGTRELPFLLEAIHDFKAPRTGNVDHWVIELKQHPETDFLVFVDLIGESIAIQVKYHK